MTSHLWRVKLEIPASTHFLHIVRLAAAGAAAEAHLDAEEIEDVKIAIDELCSVAMAASSGDDFIRLSFEATGDGLVVEATVPDNLEVEVDDMGHAIIEATVDEFHASRGGFGLTKKHRGG